MRGDSLRRGWFGGSLFFFTAYPCNNHLTPATFGYCLSPTAWATVGEELKQGQSDDWIKRAKESGVPELRSFAKGLLKDYDASRGWADAGVEQRPHRGARDQVEIAQATDVRAGQLCAAAPASVSVGPG